MVKSTENKQMRFRLRIKKKQLHWKIIHNAIFTEYKLNVMYRSDGKTRHCQTYLEQCYSFG